MTEEQVTQSGVEKAVPAAGEQEESGFDLEKILFGGDDSGVKEKEAAAPEEPKQKDDAGELPEDASKAFAKKLKEEKEKMEQEIRAKIVAELEQRTQTTAQQQGQGAGQFRPMTQEELEKLAEDLETSPKVVSILYQQQQLINQYSDVQKREAQKSADRSEYNAAVAFARKLREENSSMPDWDDESVHTYRMNHYKEYGRTLPWKEAYKMMIADKVMTGNIARETQQETIRKIQERENADVNLKAPGSKAMTIDDLTPEQFAKMKEDALAGKYKRS